MVVKEIGKGKADPETGLWGVEAKPERFIMSLRQVDTRPEVKALKAAYSRHARKSLPSSQRQKGREERFQQRRNLKTELKKLLTQVYGEILKESFSYPVPLRKDKDYDHKSDWRYCLYEGIIYQFDRAGYRGEEMIRQISDRRRQVSGTVKIPAA